MSGDSAAYRAASDAWKAVAEMADLNGTTDKAVKYARVASAAASNGNVRTAQVNAHLAKAERDMRTS